ncbi:MAG: addiction module protein [Pirellulaceae bacterium]|nr:addiction module protein [Pirellulaceae bacterium]
MSPTEEAVLGEALSLPVQSRAYLADMLWASLPEDQLDLPVDEGLRRAWAEDARRRMQEVETGKVPLLPGDEVMDRFRRRMQQ